MKISVTVDYKYKSGAQKRKKRIDLLF